MSHFLQKEWETKIWDSFSEFWSNVSLGARHPPPMRARLDFAAVSGSVAQQQGVYCALVVVLIDLTTPDSCSFCSTADYWRWLAYKAMCMTVVCAFRFIVCIV